MEIVIHMVFILSALLLSQTEKIVHSYHSPGAHEEEPEEAKGDESKEDSPR